MKLEHPEGQDEGLPLCDGRGARLRHTPHHACVCGAKLRRSEPCWAERRSAVPRGARLSFIHTPGRSAVSRRARQPTAHPSTHATPRRETRRHVVCLFIQTLDPHVARQARQARLCSRGDIFPDKSSGAGCVPRSVPRSVPRRPNLILLGRGHARRQARRHLSSLVALLVAEQDEL